MANAQIVVEMDADEAKMWQKLKRLENAEGGVEAALRAIANATKEVGRENAEMERKARRVLDSIMGPQERYNQRVAELNQLYGANKLSVDQFRAALRQVEAGYASSTQKTEAMGDATRRAGAENVELERKARRVIESLMGPQERYNQKVAELNQLYGASKLTVEQFRAAVRQIDAEYAKAGASGSQAFGPAMMNQVRGLIGALGLTGGLAGAVNLVKAEYQDLVDKQRQAGQVSVTTSQAEIGALRNLSPENEAERDKFLADMKSLSAETGVDLKDLYIRAGSALSAKGNLPTKAAVDAVELSARYVPDNASEGEAVAGAMLDLMPRIGSEDPREALGLLVQVGQKSRVQNAGFIAKNFPSALVTDMLEGDQAAEAAALFSTMTQITSDKTGERSRTAMVALANQLAVELPKMGSTRERIEAIQRSKALQEKIIPGLKFEASAEGPIKELLRNLNESPAIYKSFLAEAKTMKEYGELADQQIGLVTGTPLQQTAQIDRSAKTAVENVAMADQNDARIGVLREQFPKLMQQLGEGWLGTNFRKWEVIASGDELDDYLKSLKLRAYDLMNPREVQRGPMPMGGYIKPTFIQPNAVDIARGESLLKLVEQVERANPVPGPNQSKVERANPVPDPNQSKSAGSPKPLYQEVTQAAPTPATPSAKPPTGPVNPDSTASPAGGSAPAPLVPSDLLLPPSPANWAPGPLTPLYQEATETASPATALPPDAKRQVDTYEAGGATVVPVTPVPAGKTDDGKLDRTNNLLEDMKGILQRGLPAASGGLAPRSIAPPFEEDR